MSFIKTFSILIILWTKCLSKEITGSNYDLTQDAPVDLVAVGRVASLGELYDARSDQFLHLSIFKSHLPDSSIISTQNKQTKLLYTYINTMEEKFDKMDISAGLKLSILGGIVKLEGSGRFFKDTKKSAKSAKVSLINSISTEYEEISITETSFLSIMNFDVLQQIEATHVVVGIQWGGNVFVSVEDANNQDQDQQIVQGKLKAEVELIAAKISGQGQANVSEEERNKYSKFNFEINGDILPDEVPQDLIDALIFMRNASKALQTGNKGKGKAIEYTLIPLSLIRKLLKLEAQVNTILKRVDEETVEQCVKLFDDMNRIEQKLNDLVDYVQRYEKYILTNKVEKLMELQFNYRIYQGEVQKNLSEHLILVRSGNETADKLQETMIQAAKHPYSWQNLQINLSNVSVNFKEEISFIRILLEKNVTLLDKEQTINTFYSEHFNNDIYILFYTDQFSSNIERPIYTFRNMIENRTNYGPLAIFAAVKTELFNLEPKSKLSLVQKMNVTVEDYEIDTQVPDKDKPELWSLYFIQTQLANLLIESEKQKTEIEQDKIGFQNEIKTIKDNYIPIGFLYIQLPHQSAPQEIWPFYKWIEVTKDYAGLFFRAEGGNSLPFERIQQANYSRITQAKSHCMCGVDYRSHWGSENINIAEDGWSDSLVNDIGSCTNFNLYLFTRKAENRPINTAVRIWKRTSS